MGELLAVCCPNIEALELVCFGPEGTFGSSCWIDLWGTTLRSLAVHFWYDDCLGPPRGGDLLSDVGQGCKFLQELWLSGIDSESLNAGICRGLAASSSVAWQSLRHLRAEGSCAITSAQCPWLVKRGVLIETRAVMDRTR